MTTPPKVLDMSPAAVNRRIEDMRALYKLMLALREVKIVGPISTGAGPRGS